MKGNKGNKNTQTSHHLEALGQVKRTTAVSHLPMNIPLWPEGCTGVKISLFTQWWTWHPKPSQPLSVLAVLIPCPRQTKPKDGARSGVFPPAFSLHSKMVVPNAGFLPAALAFLLCFDLNCDFGFQV